MSLTSTNFVISQFESEKYRYFVIYDEEGDLIFSQNELIDQESAVGKMKSFIKSHEGYYTIKVVSKKLTNVKNRAQIDQNLLAKFNVEIYPNTSLTTTNNNQIGSVLPNDDPRNNAPNIYGLVTSMGEMNANMKLMEKDHLHYIEKQELMKQIEKLQQNDDKNKGMSGIVSSLGSHFNDPSVLLGLISGVSGLFKKEQVVPISGIDEQVVHNISTQQKSITNSINILLELDEDFAKNIEKLSKLCSEKPMIYKMAVGYLNNL